MGETDCHHEVVNVGKGRYMGSPKETLKVEQIFWRRGHLN